MLASFLYAFGIQRTFPVWFHNIGTSEKRILSVNRSTIGSNSRALIFQTIDNLSVSSPLILVDRDNLRRDGIDGNSVSSQLPDRCFHVSVFILSVLSSFGSYAGHIIFRRIGNWFSTQPDTQFTSCMQRNRLIIQLISKSNGTTIRLHLIIEGNTIIQHSFRNNQVQSRFLQIISLIPGKIIFLPMIQRFNRLFPTPYGETIFGSVSESIF